MDDFEPGSSLATHNFLGETEFMLHEAVTARNQTLKRPLTNKDKAAGSITIVSDESKSGNENMEFSLCLNLNKRLSDKEQAFFIIQRGVVPG